MKTRRLLLTAVALCVGSTVYAAENMYSPAERQEAEPIEQQSSPVYDLPQEQDAQTQGNVYDDQRDTFEDVPQQQEDFGGQEEFGGETETIGPNYQEGLTDPDPGIQRQEEGAPYVQEREGEFVPEQNELDNEGYYDPDSELQEQEEFTEPQGEVLGPDPYQEEEVEIQEQEEGWEQEELDKPAIDVQPEDY